MTRPQRRYGRLGAPDCKARALAASAILRPRHLRRNGSGADFGASFPPYRRAHLVAGGLHPIGHRRPVDAEPLRHDSSSFAGEAGLYRQLPRLQVPLPGATRTAHWTQLVPRMPDPAGDGLWGDSEILSDGIQARAVQTGGDGLLAFVYWDHLCRAVRRRLLRLGMSTGLSWARSPKIQRKCAEIASPKITLLFIALSAVGANKHPRTKAVGNVGLHCTSCHQTTGENWRIRRFSATFGGFWQI